MKKLLVIAVALASVNAFATRARVTALGNSPQLVDTQTVYTNPADIFGLGDYVTLETGLTTGTTATNQAEGMVVRTMGDAKMGLSLGHQSPNASTWGLRPAAFGNQQNPVEFTYGAKASDMNWAATLVYSNFNNKLAAGAAVAKESSAGVRLGARANNWDASVRLGLVNTAELGTAGTKFTGTLGLGASGGYQMDSLYWFGGITSVGYKTEAAGADTAKLSDTQINVGVMTSVKKDGSEFFYGASVTNDNRSETVSDSKLTTTNLPVWIGLEVDAASWLTLRGSVTQSVLLNSSKTDGAGAAFGATDFGPGANNTVVAAGAGLKFNKITVDGTLQAADAGANNQALNGNSLLSTLGLTYNF